MNGILERLVQFIPRSFKEFPYYGEGTERYQLLRRNLILIMCAVALIPLVLMAAINYHQYRSALEEEIFRPLHRLVTSTKHSLELFLTERRSTIRLIIREHTLEELSNQTTLDRVFQALEHEFVEFVDLGLIDSSGVQRTYSGPYGLRGKNYQGQDWFQEVKLRGTYISDVFLGYRRFPHFAIAVKNETTEGDFYVVRATIDMEEFYDRIRTITLRPGSDMFIINRKGVLQTPSRHHGTVLEKSSVPVPPMSLEPVIEKRTTPEGDSLLVGYAHLRNSRFILMVTKKPGEVLGVWFALRGELLLIFLVSVVVIVVVAFRTSSLLIDRIRTADQKREAYYAEMEQTAKLASLGRMAAGVAHEINNPLAIINEKAGLMKDLVEYSTKYQDREKFIGLVNSILRCVDRSREITHRLLGFAKRMDVKVETIHLNELIKEVLGFLEREAFHRNIKLHLDFEDDIPPLKSDRGQLQQVLLNILNNAFEAVDDGGNISISTREKNEEALEVVVADDGCGIPPDQIKHIFDPFYTSGKQHGTGLGLSISYGIVAKCGGDIKVESTVGEGTSFTVELMKECQLCR
jgi:two-component system NtrC family sensor kinase